MRRDLVTKWARINDRRDHIRSVVHQNGAPMTTEEVWERVSMFYPVTDRTVLADLKAMKDQGRIRGLLKSLGGTKYWLWESRCEAKSSGSLQ